MKSLRIQIQLVIRMFLVLVVFARSSVQFNESYHNCSRRIIHELIKDVPSANVTIVYQLLLKSLKKTVETAV